MLRILVVLAAVVVSGCATQPDYSHLRSDEPLTHYMIRFEPPYRIPDFPHRRWERVDAIAEDRVPLFEPGTPYPEVMDTLIDWGLDPIPVTKANAIVVLQGPSRRNFGAADPVHVLYSFDGEALAFGPSDPDDLGRRLTEEEYDERNLLLLTTLDEIASIDSGTLNDIAWELATHPLPGHRYPTLALSIAQRAANDSGFADYFIVDTLAAAHAAVGDFESAVNFQEIALVLADGEDPELDERLLLYQNEQAYAQYSGGFTAENPFPLLQRAIDGDTEALHQIGYMCIERPVHPCLGKDADAFEWFEAAATEGYANSVDIMAYARLLGVMGSHQDLDEGKTWLKQGLENDSAVAVWHAATAVHLELMQTRDDALITQLLRLAADAEIWDAGFELGYRLIEGIGTEPDPVAGETYIAKAKEAGVDEANFMYHEDIYPFERSFDQSAIDLIREQPVPVRSIPSLMLSLADDLLAQADEGFTTVRARFTRHHIGWSAEDADFAAIELIRRAARLGSADAQRRLATYYAKGQYVEASEDDANYWRDRAKRNQSGL